MFKSKSATILQMERNGKFLKFECQHGQQECEVLYKSRFKWTCGMCSLWNKKRYLLNALNFGDGNINALKGNMWHVCAVEHLKEDLDAQFNFTECMLHDMSRGTLKEVATKCSVSTKVFGAISSCVTGSHGEWNSISIVKFSPVSPKDS